MSNVIRYVKVGGYQSVTTPAGTFNAIVMRTLMSVDDNNPFRFPTECNYEIWWSESVAPRYARRSSRPIASAATRWTAHCNIRAQNTLIELASYSPRAALGGRRFVAARSEAPSASRSHSRIAAGLSSASSGGW